MKKGMITAGLVAVAPEKPGGIFHAARGPRVEESVEQAHHPAVFRSGEALAGERALHQLRIFAMVRIGIVQINAGFEIGERPFTGFKPRLGFGERQGAEAAFIAGDEMRKGQFGPAEDDAKPQADARGIGTGGRAMPAGVGGRGRLAGRCSGAGAFAGIGPVALDDVVGCHGVTGLRLDAWCDRV